MVRGIAGGVRTPPRLALNGGAAGAGQVNSLGLPRSGGLILRWAVLKSGTLPTWHMAGFEFRRNPRPQAPKPEIGHLPPA